MDEQQIRDIVKQEIQAYFAGFIGSDRYTFQKNIQVADGRKIQLGRTTGTRIGTEGYVSASNQGQRLSFYGVTPVVQAQAISAPSGGGTGVTDAIDNSARTAINNIRTAIKNIGITL